MADTIAAFGGVDVLVSNAGIQIVHPVEEFSYAEWKKMLAIHLDGAFLTTRECMKDMQARGQGGAIIYMGSVHSHLASKLKAPYVTAKHGLLGLCRTVAKEGGEHGIRANMLNPDAIFGGSRFWSDEMRSMRAQAYGVDTDRLPDFYRNRTLLKVEVTADDVAEAALFLAGPRSAKTTGMMLPVDGGVKEAFPR